jgi:hypothetical protein
MTNERSRTMYTHVEHARVEQRARHEVFVQQARASRVAAVSRLQRKAERLSRRAERAAAQARVAVARAL